MEKNSSVFPLYDPRFEHDSCGIGAVGLYYLVLYLVRERLQNEYVFTIASK